MKKFSDLLVIPVMVFSAFLMLLSSAASGMPNLDQKEKIRQDIEILEGVLEQLIIKESPYLFSAGDQVNSLYLDGFGLIFDLQSNGLLSLSDMISRSIRHLPRVKIDTDAEEQIIVTLDKEKKPDSAEVDEKAEVEKSLRKTEELIIEFFRDYASTVTSLSPQDRICVNLRNSRGFRYGMGEDLKVPEQLRASGLVGDLNDYRLGKINESKLKARIRIERIYEAEQNRDLEIFSRILDRAVGQETGSRWIPWDGKTRYMYQEGYGAIFFVQLSALKNLEKIIVKNVSEIEHKLRDFETDVRKYEKRVRDIERSELPAPPDLPSPPSLPIRKEKRIFVDKNGDSVEVDLDFDVDINMNKIASDTEIDSLMDAVAADIIDMLGQYGATLRSVKKGETILVTVDFSRQFWTVKPNTLYLKVRKSDVERCTRDGLTSEQFKQAVTVWKE